MVGPVPAPLAPLALLLLLLLLHELPPGAGSSLPASDRGAGGFGTELSPNISCASCSACATAALNNTGWAGRQLFNVTWDLPPVNSVPDLTCCSASSSAAGKRSQNSTAGLPWSSRDLGPAIDPERAAQGQRSFLCTVYDYGAAQAPARGSVAAATPKLPFLPPPPPACSSYSTLSACPARCFWSSGACAALPPIECGSNVRGTPHRNNGLCVHLILNISSSAALQFMGTIGSFNETILQHPPPQVRGGEDAWWSVWDGEDWSPPGLHPFRLCVQYASLPDKTRQVAVCVSLLGGAFDLQIATTPNLVKNGSAAQYGWQSNDPYVAAVTIGENITAEYHRTASPAAKDALMDSYSSILGEE